MTTTETRHGPDALTWAGLVVVGLVAIVWSFTALSDLARIVGVTATIPIPWGWELHVAWGLPVTVDVLALVATRAWLRGAIPADAVRYARRVAWGAIIATVIGNGYHGLLAGDMRIDAVIISAAPAVVIGVIVHLAVLAGRPAVGPQTNTPTEARPVEAVAVVEADEPRPIDAPEPRPAPALAPVPTAVEDEPTEESEAPDRPELDPPMSDGQVIAEAKAWARELGRPPSRDEMLKRYSMGAPRARKLRIMLGWQSDPAEKPTAADRQSGEPVGAAS